MYRGLNATRYANHANYVLRWKGDVLKRILEMTCIFNCEESEDSIPSVEAMNSYTQMPAVEEDIDGCNCFIFRKFKV